MKNAIRIGVMMFLFASLCVPYFFLSLRGDTGFNRSAFQIHKSTQQTQNARAWRGRLLSTLPASAFEPTRGNIAKWNCAWLFAALALYMAAGRRVLYYAFGTFAALIFAAVAPSAGYRFYPWDGPALFVFVLALICILRGWDKALVAVAVVGAGFKETAVVLALVFLFWDGLTLRQRVARFLAVGAGCTLVKWGCGLAAQNTAMLLTPYASINLPDVSDSVIPLWCLNLHALRPKLEGIVYDHMLFVNGGTLIASLLLPVGGWRVRAFRATMLVFVTMLFVMAITGEYRVFHEMIPFSLYIILEYLEKENGAMSPSPAARTA